MAKDPRGKAVKAGRIGDLKYVKNTMKRLNACDVYLHIRAQDSHGCEFHLLLTEHELKRAMTRALRNEEDLPKPGLLQDLLD
jgi:hypothetical protein